MTARAASAWLQPNLPGLTTTGIRKVWKERRLTVSSAACRLMSSTCMEEAHYAAMSFLMDTARSRTSRDKAQLALGIRSTVSLHPFRDRAMHRARPMPEPPPVTSTALLAQAIPDTSLISDGSGMLAIEQYFVSVVS